MLFHPNKKGSPLAPLPFVPAMAGRKAASCVKLT
jgi:hypothetical protein